LRLAPESALAALSPLDGRYAGKLDALREHFSEFALIRSRVRIEIAWLLALADCPGIREVPAFDAATRDSLIAAGTTFTLHRPASPGPPAGAGVLRKGEPPV
jgi:adenylosuccinate lyase